MGQKRGGKGLRVRGKKVGVGVWCRETSWGAVAHLPLQKPALLGCGAPGRMPRSGQKQVPQAPEAQCVARTRRTCGADQHWAWRRFAGGQARAALPWTPELRKGGAH